MCGIAGYFSLTDRGIRADSDELLSRQINTISHRGPDALQTWTGPGVGLAHARLSIIDLSSNAHQPMLSDDGQLAIVFNGEIYNFQEVREELRALGHVFRTSSDTEVILHGYRQWGADVVHRLRGMFAYALHDAREETFILARDRVGKKPLSYAVVDGVLVFGSEIKSLLVWPGMKREADLSAIHDYLTYQYVPSPQSAFVGVRKLPPASMLVVRRGRMGEPQRYFDWPTPAEAVRRPREQLIEELHGHLREATRLRMIADVPLGAFLSGGVDSSAVVAFMAMQSEQPVRTFTIGFDEAQYDERAYARMVAERYGTRHEEFVVRPNAAEILDDLVYLYNEPYADSSAVPSYLVSKIARQHVTVVLNGDGGDEAFLGYSRYRACRQLAGLDSALPGPIGKALAALAGAAPRALDRFKLVRHGRQALMRRFEPRSRRYETFIAYFSDAAKGQLYAGDMRNFLARSSLDALDRFFDAAPTFAWGAQWADLHTYLPDDLLVKMDIATMAHGLEGRSPFLDHELLSWACTVPEDQRFEGNEPKSLLKQAMEPYLPHDVLYRPKMGFGVPIDRWLRTELKDAVYDLLTGETARARGLFDIGEVRALLGRHMGGENWASRIWALLMLEMWFRMWIDTPTALSHPTAARLGDSGRHTERVAVPGRTAA
ncbi:asparagine synthase (glutamine-hydrolyzing) [Roseomonas sp. PWR1]|uniref:asparagine synthase (glutamine-hydrolyzing) n=1 Tax=Roseomonas nitratireducens TaxID=2820810 RepID=A0ABS4AMI3_9PROT|nr:asparagine synthase (glutamine-hydrolyzing) [Neoroseomonas nitratireducens]MBP0462573.1 asparagine synthase (glutamine-hydrolyzing) [Neoroseomonas nitratireducens]